MEDLSDIGSLTLRSLSNVTRTLLSTLLNSTKVIPTEGPVKRHRDWRGLASLVNISAEVEATIWDYRDRTGKVLEIWMASQGGTVEQLLQHLITLDRYDVRDDIIESIREQMQQRPDNQVALPNDNRVQVVINDDSDSLTFEDQPGHMHNYHAFILYAEEDHDFVNYLRRILETNDFEICSKDNLLPGFASKYPPLARLLDRCHRIILIYSPAFLCSSENSYLRDHAHAMSIERNQRKLLPVMYKRCELPLHLRPYHNLYYDGGSLIFWQRLIKCLDNTRVPRVDGIAAPAPPQIDAHAHSYTHSAVNIQTMPVSNHQSDDDRYFLPPSSAPIKVPNGCVSVTASNNSLASSVASTNHSLSSLQLNTTDNLIKPAKKKKIKVKKILDVFSPSTYRKKK